RIPLQRGKLSVLLGSSHAEPAIISGTRPITHHPCPPVLGQLRRNCSPCGVVGNPPGAVGIAPANPALPTAEGLPLVVGYPYEARSGRPLSGEPAVAEGSSQFPCGTGHSLPCSS